jgi:6-phosphofructokinase 1
MVNNGEFGKIAALRGTDIISADMKDALGKLKTVPKKRYEEAKVFFGVEG